MHLNVMLMLAVHKRSCFGASHLVILGVDSYNQVCIKMTLKNNDLITGLKFECMNDCYQQNEFSFTNIARPAPVHEYE